MHLFSQRIKNSFYKTFGLELRLRGTHCGVTFVTDDSSNFSGEYGRSGASRADNDFPCLDRAVEAIAGNERDSFDSFPDLPSKSEMEQFQVN